MKGGGRGKPQGPNQHSGASSSRAAQQAHVADVAEYEEEGEEWPVPDQVCWGWDTGSDDEGEFVIDFDMEVPGEQGSCCRTQSAGKPVAKKAPLHGVHIADKSMGGPLPLGFPVKMTTRSASKPVAARVLEAEAKSSKPDSKPDGEKKAKPKAAGKGAASGKGKGAVEQISVPQKPYIMLVAKEDEDKELIEKLRQAGDREGLAVMLMPGKVLRAEVVSGMLDVQPAVGMTATVADYLDSQQDAVFAASLMNMRPQLPYIGEGACRFKYGDRWFELKKVLIDSGASGGVIALHVATECKLPVEPDNRKLGAAGGVISTAGRVKGLSMELRFNDSESVSLQFDGIVLGGQQSSYDAILGRKQMHRLGMVLDFYRQQCWVRPWLYKGDKSVRALPMQCVSSSSARQANLELDAVTVADWGQQQGVPRGVHAGFQEQRLLASGDVEENPGPEGIAFHHEAVFYEPEWYGIGPMGPQDGGDFEFPPGWCYRKAEKIKSSWVAGGFKLPELWVPLVSGLPKYRDVMHMLVCMLVVLVAGLEQLRVVAGGSWWQCWVCGLIGIHTIIWMGPVLECWGKMKYLPEWKGQYRLKARVQRQYHKAKKREVARDARAGRGSRWDQRLRRVWLGPLVKLPALLLLAGLFIVGAQAGGAAVHVADIAEGCVANGMRGWDAGAAVRGAANAHWRDMEWAGAALTAPVEGCFAAGFGAGQVPSHALESLDPVGAKDKPEGAPETYKDAAGEFTFSVNKDFDNETKLQLEEAVRNRRESFAFTMQDLPGYKEKVSWQLKTDKPIRVPCHARRFSPAEYDIMDTKVKELEDAGMVVEVEATAAYAAMPVIAAKKNVLTHEWTDHRFCVNFIPLNAQMVTHNYAAPLPEHIFERAAGCSVFSTVDLRAGFHQLIPTDECQEHLCFWHRRRLMKYTRLPFGIKNALPIFQQVIDKVLLEGGCSEFACAYVDDIAIMSATPQEHVVHVSKVLDCLREAGLRAHPSKSCFGSPELEFIGHMLGKNGTLSPLQAKVAAIMALPEPQNVAQLQHVMGIINYYRCYIPNASSIASPINELTKKEAAWDWGPKQSAAFKQLKEALTSEPVLRQPDEKRPFILHTDWSTTGIGAVLAQLDEDGREYMVACTSRSLNVHEKRYTPWKGELLGVVFGVKTFRHYLMGRHFSLVTDHRPLLGLLTTAEPNCQQSRWLMALQEHEFTVIHRPGTQHVNADVLSRWPRQSDSDPSGARMDSGPILAPTLPAVVVDGVLHTGAARVEQLGQQLSQDFAQQWARPKKQSAVEPNLQSGGAAAASSSAAETVLLAAGTPGAWIDAMAPDDAYFLHDMDCSLEELDPPSALELEDWELQQVIADSVQAAQQVGAPSQVTLSGGGDVDTSCCANSFFPWVLKQGVVVFEPFGGLGAGLEMMLRQGIKIRKYVYADISPVARSVIAFRMAALQQRYPHLLASSAVEDALKGPQDVYQYTADVIFSMMRPNEQWLMVAGWECQDLSAAGSGAGLEGKRSKSYYKLIDMLQWLQAAAREHGNPAVGYVVENTAFQYNWKHPHISRKDFEEVNFTMGQPVAFDAAKFGSRAHRLRNFWTNLVEPSKLVAAVEHAERPAGRLVSDILEPGREEMPVTFSDKHPWYQCNIEGSPREAWPTLMAYRGSYNFRPGKPGAVWDHQQQRVTEPTAVERERALGYHDNDTAAPGVTEEERRGVLGRCIDANAAQAVVGTAREVWATEEADVCCVAGVERDAELQVLAGIAQAWWLLQPSGAHWEEIPEPDAGWQPVREGGVACCLAEFSELGGNVEGLPEEVVCVIDDQAAAVLKEVEVYEDQGLMHYLQHQQMPAGATSKEKDRIQHKFSLSNGVLKRRMADGRWCVVPKPEEPEEREPLVQDTHVRSGHFAVKRLMSQLLHNYWWRGMKPVVKKVVSSCSQCDRANVSFTGLNPKLQSLPIRGLFYRWHVDLATKLPESKRGNTCIMIMIDAFSKLVEVVPMKSKSPEFTSRAIRELFGRYGAPAQVVTDRGPEFQDEFADVLVQYMVDHTPTTAGNPQGNGQAERAVQVVKRSLKKVCESTQSVKEWENHLPDLVLGYNCGVQQSTGYAPYTLVYGVPPVLPAARRERLDQSINIENVEEAVKDLVERAAIMGRNAAMAANNLLIAQRRDQLTYARKRDGTYLPKVKVYQEGDYVYVRTASECVAGSGLALAVEPRVLRVVQSRDNGTVLVEGRDGSTRVLNARNLTLCHNPSVDGEIDWSLSKPPADFPCSVCKSALHWGELLLCEGCGLGFHLWCHQPKLSAVPEGDFICASCGDKGVTAETLDKRQLQSIEQQVAREEYKQFKAKANPTALQKKKNLANAALEGRLVKKKIDGRVQWGRISFKGAGVQPPFAVIYEDGSTEECSNHHIAKRKDWMQPVGVKLPAGVQLPTLDVANVAEAIGSADRWTASEGVVTAGAIMALLDRFSADGLTITGSPRVELCCQTLGYTVDSLGGDLALFAPSQLEEELVLRLLTRGKAAAGVLVPEEWWQGLLGLEELPEQLGSWITDGLVWVWPGGRRGFVWVVCFTSLLTATKLCCK